MAEKKKESKKLLLIVGERVIEFEKVISMTDKDNVITVTIDPKSKVGGPSVIDLKKNADFN